ncbi:MAG: enoyl-CoA hydratase/isomerase family protein [Gemmatimonadota bacterium]|nr:enoyl-CoA hydratase/isomerase family protein [Gemmatimonadota bacterium]
MADAPVLLEKRDDAIAVITLNRPEKLNALNAEVRGLLKEIFADLSRDDDVKVVVIHGTGDKAFVAGADISEFAARTAMEQRAVYAEPRIYEVVGSSPSRSSPPSMASASAEAPSSPWRATSGWRTGPPA